MTRVARYGGDGGIVLCGQMMLMMVEAEAGSKLIDDLWPRVHDGDLHGVLGVLAAAGLDRLPSFGVVCPRADAVRVLVRGTVQVAVRHGDGRAETVRAEQVSTWQETPFPGDIAAAILTLSQSRATDSSELPLLAGVVHAGIVEWNLTAPAQAGKPVPSLSVNATPAEHDRPSPPASAKRERPDDAPHAEHDRPLPPAAAKHGRLGDAPHAEHDQPGGAASAERGRLGDAAGAADGWPLAGAGGGVAGNPAPAAGWPPSTSDAVLADGRPTTGAQPPVPMPPEPPQLPVQRPRSGKMDRVPWLDGDEPEALPTRVPIAVPQQRADHFGDTLRREPTVGGSELEPAAASPRVSAVRCPRGHFNPTNNTTCRQCHEPIDERQFPEEIDQPSLGSLCREETGERWSLSRPLTVVGREPRAAGLATLVHVAHASQDVSRIHLELYLQGWHVEVVDRSTHGTYVVNPGHDPVRLERHQPVRILPGARLVLAGEVRFKYEVS